MSTAIAEPGSLMVMTAASVTPKAFDVDVESIKGKATQYQSLKVNGLADKLGLKTVREARFELARVRCDIEKRRQEIKAGALAFGKAVDAEAKRLTALVEPTEQALKAIEDDIAKEEQREKDKRTAERMKLLSAVDSRYPEVVVAAMPDKDFDKLLAELTADHERRKEESRLKAEQEAAERAQRQADEAEKKRVADDELAARREELRKQEAVRNQREAQEAEQRRQADAEMAAEREALRKQREAQEDEQRRLDKIRTEQEQAERAKLQEAEAERSRKAEAERQAREEQERADKEAADAARREAMKPDYDKLVDVAKALRKLKLPTVSAAASVARNRIKLLIDDAADEVEEVAAKECGVKHEE